MKAEGADVVVAIPHSGFERLMPGAAVPPLAENAVARLSEVPGIDAILFGHSHGEFPGPFFAGYPRADVARGTIGGVAAVMPGRWGDHLGVIDLVLDDRSGRWQVTDGRGALRPVWDRAARKPLVEADPAIAALIAEEHAATLAYVRTEVARTRVPIHSYFAQVADDPSVQLVAQAQLAYLKRAVQGTEYESLPMLSAAAPFKTGGRMGWTYYTDIPAGPIAVRGLADLYVYPNTFKAVLLTGAQVREWLEMAAGQFNRIDPAGPPEQDLVNPAFPSYNFDIRGRAEHLALARQVGGVADHPRILRDLHQTEVEDLRRLLFVRPHQHHVLRLEIAVHEAERMRRAQPAGDLPHQIRRARRLHRALGADRFGERLSVEQLHGHEDQPLGRDAEVHRGHHVRMFDLARGLRFPLKAPRQVLVAGEVAEQQLHREVLIEIDLPRAIDPRHAAVTERRDDLVAIDLPPEHRIDLELADALAVDPAELLVLAVAGPASRAGEHGETVICAGARGNP